MATDVFDADLFETRLEALKDTQESIIQFSNWCISQRQHHKKIVACWLNVFKRVRVEQRLTLYYLANDVIQNSKKRKIPFVETWATALQRATTMVRDAKVKDKILRTIDIWGHRGIYNSDFLADLKGLLKAQPTNTTIAPKPSIQNEDGEEFQSSSLVEDIRESVKATEAAEKSHKKIPPLSVDPNIDIRQQLKDRTHAEEVGRDLERFVAYLEAYKKNLHNEIKCRKSLIANLKVAQKFFSGQRGEVKVVVSAYKNFGHRIKIVRKKLLEMAPTLPSPIPSPDINAPSPERDADLQLPDDQPSSLNIFQSSINGYASFMDRKLPFNIDDFKRDTTTSSKSSSQPIEVIGSRSDDEKYGTSINFYSKSDPITISAYSTGSNVAIPGLNPMPVPPVESEYTSLARTAQQYGGLISQQNPLYGSSNYYDTPDSSYLNSSSDTSYVSGGNNSIGNSVSGGSNTPLMPPPPIPPSGLAGNAIVPPMNSNDSFNSSWESMPWNAMDNSNGGTPYNNSTVETPVSPPHFDREALDSNRAAIEYSEHNNSGLMSTEDVDHRQLMLPPAFNTVSNKLGLSKEKTRQLDIDHRNLISLTGSPNTSDVDKKSSSSWSDSDYCNSSGDVDFRALMRPNINSNQINQNKKDHSPQKHSADSQKDENATNMVIDMDMSDEDLEGLENIREGLLMSGDAAAALKMSKSINEKSPEKNQRGPLLEAPPEYVPQSIWDATGSIDISEQYIPENIGMDMQQQQQQQSSNWNPTIWGNDNDNTLNAGNPTVGVPPPPRPPFPLSFQQYSPGGSVGVGGGTTTTTAPGNNDYGNGNDYGNTPSLRGRGRGWFNSPPPPLPQYRNYTPRGGGGGGAAGGGLQRSSPYYGRGGARGNFRGKFRGGNNNNSSWL